MADQQKHHSFWIERARAFIGAHPEFGILALIIVAYPILAIFLGDSDKIGTLVWIGIVFVAIPVGYLIIRRLVDEMLENTILRKVLSWITAICFSCIGLFGTLVAISFLYAQTSLVGLEVSSRDEEAHRSQPTLLAVLASLSASVVESANESKTLDEQINLPVTSERSVEADPVVIPTNNAIINSEYERCINESYAKGNADEIIACVEHLEK